MLATAAVCVEGMGGGNGLSVQERVSQEQDKQIL